MNVNGLALRTLGTLLRGNDECKWISIGGISFAELPDEKNSIMTILKLSYLHLPSPLKHCYAYCALFPKGYKFEKEMLFDLWMAEGFVVPAIETQSLNELCDEYLMILLQRCFFQDITRDKWGNISSFKMHDLMHDLAVEVAGTETKMTRVEDVDFSDRICRLSFGYHLTSSWEIPSLMLKTKQLRTFLLTKQYRDGSDFNKAVLQQIIFNFRCLRVLDLHNLGYRTVPKSIGKLIHLRYLDLSRNPIQELPHSITKLCNLQTLILYCCTRLRALPRDTRKLVNLRNLDVRCCDLLRHMPSGLGELTSLHKLPCFILTDKPPTYVRPALLRDLKALNNLRGSLKIKFQDELERPASQAKEANLSKKHDLTVLVVSFRTVLDANARVTVHDEAILEGLKPNQNLKQLHIEWYSGHKFPSWAIADSLCMTLPHLVEINLLRCPNCQHVPSFRQLPFLRCLLLSGVESAEYMEMSPHRLQSTAPPSPFTETFFPSLQDLRLVGMDKLRGWWEETQSINFIDHEEVSSHANQHRPLSPSFSHLASLVIQYCPNLASFPLSPNVEELILVHVPRNLTVLKKLANPEVSSDVGSSPFPSTHNSKLKYLSVGNVEDLISLPEECLGQLPSLSIQDHSRNHSQLEEVFKRLCSLRFLQFYECRALTSISEVLEHLPSLEALVIVNAFEPDLSQNEELLNGMPWKSLKSLLSLDLSGLHKLMHLPSGFQHLRKLRSLKISRARNLVALPRWISCFSSLEYLKLDRCPKVTCLPEELGLLTTLNQLEIMECPGLTRRCRGPNGRDWPKIRHIPLLTITENRRY